MTRKIEVYVLDRTPTGDDSDSQIVGVASNADPRHPAGMPPCPYVIIVDGRSTGELSFDEMLGTVAKLALKHPVTYAFRTPADVEAAVRKQGERTINEARKEVEATVSRRLSQEFPS